MKIVKLIAILAMIFSAQVVHAVCVQQTTIFYINGVDNTIDDAKLSRGELEKALLLKDPRISDCVTVKLAYNKSENRIADLSEALRQRTLEAGLTATNFWEMWERLIPSQNWFTEAFRTAMSTEQVLYDARDPKILAQINEHIDTLYRLEPTGNQILFVAHSQGNFFGNEERLGMLERFPQVGTRVKMVSVATPSDNVAGDIKPYTTLTEDKLINNNFAAALPALTTNGNTGGECSILGGVDEYICHGWIESYMVPDSKSRKEIVDNVIATAFPTATILGTVRDFTGGTSFVSGATVSLFSNTTLIAETVTDTQGLYHFDKVPAPCPACFVKAKSADIAVCGTTVTPVIAGEVKVADITLDGSCDALPSVQYLRLLTGNPGVPGDGVIVTVTERERFIFEPQPIFSLQRITNGMTVSVFPPMGIPLQTLGVGVLFGTTGFPFVECFGMGGFNVRATPPPINGVSGVAVIIPQNTLNSLIALIRELPNCTTVSVSDLFVVGVTVSDSANPANPDIRQIDAISIGIGENVFPTSATPAP